MARKPTIKEISYQCPFCDKKYKREVTLTSHKCEKRDRYNDRESRTFREGYRLWKSFMDFYALKLKKDVDPIMQFVKSQQFSDFYKLAEYSFEHYIVNREDFLQYIITSGLPSFLWTTSKTYTEWVYLSTRREHPRRGIERSIMAINDWSILTGHDWNTFFDNVSTERMLMYIETGMISPWLIYVARKESGDKILAKFSPEEGRYLIPFLDPNIWNPLALKYEDEVQKLRELLTEYGL